MWAAIVDDVPPAVIASFLATLLIVVVAFRARRAAARVLFALLIGVSWMGGMLAVLQVKLNFLNFIALPITFGIGSITRSTSWSAISRCTTRPRRFDAPAARSSCAV